MRDLISILDEPGGLAHILTNVGQEPAMEQINLYDAKSHLSDLVERAAAGEEIIIAKDGRPLARLVPLSQRTAPRPLGLFAAEVAIGADFDDPLPEDMRLAFAGADR